MVPTLPFDQLAGNPFQRVVAIGQRRAENVVIAFRKKVTALVHGDVRVTAFDGFDDTAHIARNAIAHVPVIEVVRRANKHHRIFSRRVFRAIQIRRHAFAVAHTNHQLAFDDGDFVQFFFKLVSLRSHFGRELAASLA